jgi:hypothetical protein
MNRWRRIKLPLLGAALGLWLRPDTLLACAACYGQSDSPLAQGLNWGIFALLGVVLTVLTGVVAFFVHVARRTGAPEATPPVSKV